MAQLLRGQADRANSNFGKRDLAPVDGHKLGIEAGTESLPINGDGSSVFAAAKSGYQLDNYGSDPRRIG
jgi:hypothetical protein